MNRHEENAKEMNKYLEELKELAKTDPERARIESRASLIQSGVLNEDGTPKKQIVNGGYLL